MKLYNKFLKFLKSEDKVLYIENQDGTFPRYFYFSKIPYNNSIDMLFMTYTHYNKILTNDKLEYRGKIIYEDKDFCLKSEKQEDELTL